MSLDQFIARWSVSGDAERANKDSFLNELCDELGVERPHPKTGNPELGEVAVDDVPRRFRGVQVEQAAKLLESLAAVGVALEAKAAPGGKRTWSLVR